MDISPDKQNIDGVFSNTTYHIDFYQRDYKWTGEPVRRLMDDIFYGFDEAYQKKRDLDPKPENVIGHYPWYYLNTYVTNTVDGRVYVVDGQQRLTTLTLILIKLRHLARAFGSKLDGWIERKITGQAGFEHRFWMNHERHVETLEKLFDDDSDLEGLNTESGVTAANIVNNYAVISVFLLKALPNRHKLETFVFYFLHRIVMVNLTAEQTDVPMIFEVINDRGVRLRPYEILKGKLLGQIDKRELDQDDYNGLWEQQVELVNNGILSEEIDSFFRYYLKAKFSDTRSLGQRFDGDYHREMFKSDLNSRLKLEHDPTGVKKFLKGAFRYYTSLYAKLSTYTWLSNDKQPWAYLNALNEMDSQNMLVLSACRIDDPEEDQKVNLISRHLDRLFVLLRLQRAYDSNVFNDAVFEISKTIRDQPAVNIPSAFNSKLLALLADNRSVTVNEPFQYAFFRNTAVSDLSARFTRYFFARIDEFLAKEMRLGMKHPIGELVTKTGAKTGFHIEHILARNDKNIELYENEEQFEEDRNRLGGILLLKGRDNQSSNKERYAEKLKSYANTLYWNETLRRDTYKSKLDMKELMARHQLAIQPYDSFGPQELEARQKLLFDISSIVWAP